MPLDERVVVVLNGRFTHEARLLEWVDSADWVIAADGGANWLDAHGRTPQEIVGDMDSVSPELLQRLAGAGCRIQRYPASKDETDGELALASAFARGPREILVLGALGGRIDHTLANLSLLIMPEGRELNVRIYDGVSTVQIVGPGAEVDGSPGDTVSLIPWGGDAIGVHTEGLQYPLRGETLRFGPSRGISNVLLTSHARVWLSAGRLLLVHTPHQQPEAGP
ncbi:MAG: thiamine diphosphokinase [Chloroflexi bacterium]|nr:thiamine diphosphokinase [Chloroflexota bacterium]